MNTMAEKKARVGARKAASKPSIRGARTGAKMPSAKTTVLKRAAGGEAAAKKVAARKAVAGKVANKAVAKKTVAKKAATHILSAPKGARTLTHNEIKQAVKRVFEARYGAHA